MEQKPEVQALSPRVLSNAAQKLGGVAALSRYLGVGDATLADWMVGRSVPPVEIVLKAAGVLIDEPAASVSRGDPLAERRGTRE